MRYHRGMSPGTWQLAERFEQLSQLEDRQIDLGEAALLVASNDYPELRVEDWIERLDLLAERVASNAAGVDGDLMSSLIAYLFEDYGLRGNRLDYYDPRNSFLHEVLERRLGIPISLGVVVIEVGRRLGLACEGIGFPVHFLVGQEGDRDQYIDPFDRGRTLTRRQCRRFLHSLTKGALRFDASYLEPISNREILLRMLNNLKAIYLRNQDTERALYCLDRVIQLYPEEPINLRERGLLRLRLQRATSAIDDLESYLRLAHSADDRPSIESWIAQARRQGVVVN